MTNLARTALVADPVPGSMSGRLFASRNMVLGFAVLVVSLLTGRIISIVNVQLDSLIIGYQAIFFTFLFGIVSTFRLYSGTITIRVCFPGPLPGKTPSGTQAKPGFFVGWV